MIHLHNIHSSFYYCFYLPSCTSLEVINSVFHKNEGNYLSWLRNFRFFSPSCRIRPWYIQNGLRQPLVGNVSTKKVKSHNNNFFKSFWKGLPSFLLHFRWHYHKYITGAFYYSTVFNNNYLIESLVSCKYLSLQHYVLWTLFRFVRTAFVNGFPQHICAKCFL